MQNKILIGITEAAVCLFLIFAAAIGDDGTTSTGFWICLIGMALSMLWIWLFCKANPDWAEKDD
ncbi:MAG: hypothetical protein LKG48_04620 [Lachnospiraceae bacterium]|jgi:hypothetical protein|nr:hypothetical protein [Lachnospiraceae bacterium]MCH4104309.1 hypothetical protein [Lachnospiraceae bacterium]MCI1309030.1 hypothetical protein [Lachnospiraceae bacterium]MCI1357057.1 hypothetical protein [Lachnospiraceae bacterium]MCI1357125.1 hypothetical protein [Lachnospiraceae bacterium]